MIEIVEIHKDQPMPPSKGCNRHKDCAAARAAYLAEHKREMPWNQCCNDEFCEDCFGS